MWFSSDSVRRNQLRETLGDWSIKISAVNRPYPIFNTSNITRPEDHKENLLSVYNPGSPNTVRKLSKQRLFILVEEMGSVEAGKRQMKL